MKMIAGHEIGCRHIHAVPLLKKNLDKYARELKVEFFFKNSKKIGSFTKT